MKVSKLIVVLGFCGAFTIISCENAKEHNELGLSKENTISNWEAKTDWAIDQLNGSVAELSEETFVYQNDELQKDPVISKIKKFDEKGYLMEIIELGYNPLKWEILRDDEGKIIKQLGKKEGSSEIKVTITNEYDHADNLILQKYVYGNNDQVYTYTSVYDMNNRRIKLDVDFNGNNDNSISTLFEYENDLVSKSIETLKDNRLETIFSYDENGRIVREENERDKKQYEYKIDAEGNWIERVTIVNGQKQVSIKREITYY